MFKRMFQFLILVVFVSACTPSTTTATTPPDTPIPGQPTFTPTPEEPPKIEEEPLPVIPSERGHHPYNWQPEDVKGLDMWGDSTSDATDIIAIYQREMDGNFEFRLDIMNFEADDELAPIYFAIDFLEGGSKQVESGSSTSFDIEWDLLVSVVDGKFTLYDPAFNELTDQLTNTEINHQLDFVFFAISEEDFAGWDGEPFQIQALLLNDANSAVLDHTTTFATDDITGQAKLVLTFLDTFYSSSPHEAAKHYDGFREFSLSGRSNEREGERRGIRYLLDATESYEIPLTISDHRIEEFPGSEYLRFNERIRQIASKELLDPLTTLGFGHFMPWQPDDIDARSIEIAVKLRERLDLPVSDVFYPYEGMLTPGDIQVIKDAGFEAIYAHDQAPYSFFGHLEDWSDPAVVKEYFRTMRKIHQFNSMKFVFWNWFGFAQDDRWGDTKWPADEYEWFTGTDQGLHLWWRRILQDLAMDPDQEQYYTLGTDLSKTPWGVKNVVEWNLQWLASHPWIEVTTFSNIVNRGWEVIDHEELDVADDELLMRYKFPGDWYYNAYFPQHYYGGISDGHSPLIPAGVEIEAYYDYVPYLRDGEPIPSGRIMGDDKTPDSIVCETVANLREAPDNTITTLAWLSYLNQIGEQTFHDGAVLSETSKHQANFLGQVNKIVEAAHWAAEAESGSLTSATRVYEKDLDLDGELEYVIHNDQVFAIFENDGGRLEYAFAFDAEYGPVQLISPASQYFFKPNPEAGFDFKNGEAAIPLAWSWRPDGAFVEDLDSDGQFEYELLTAFIEDQHLSFNYQTRSVTKSFTLEGDTIHVHYEFGSSNRFNLGLSTTVNRLGVFDKDWIRNFELIEMQEALGWQMTSGGAVLLNLEDDFNIETASFYDSPAREEMQLREDESTYPEGNNLCFPCSWIKIWDTQETDFSLTLSAAPIDKSTYTAGPTSSTGQMEAGQIVYDDELAEGWSLDPRGGTVDLSSSASVFKDSNVIEFTLEPGGTITFDNAGFDTSPFEYMVFYFNGGATADQELYVEMKSGDATSLGKAELTDTIEDYPLRPDTWYQVKIPLKALNPGMLPFAWFDFGDASGNGAATFYVDEIRFVTISQ